MNEQNNSVAVIFIVPQACVFISPLPVGYLTGWGVATDS